MPRCKHADVQQLCFGRYPAHGAMRGDNSGNFGAMRLRARTGARQCFHDRGAQIWMRLVDARVNNRNPNPAAKCDGLRAGDIELDEGILQAVVRWRTCLLVAIIIVRLQRKDARIALHFAEHPRQRASVRHAISHQAAVERRDGAPLEYLQVVASADCVVCRFRHGACDAHDHLVRHEHLRAVGPRRQPKGRIRGWIRQGCRRTDATEDSWRDRGSHRDPLAATDKDTVADPLTIPRAAFAAPLAHASRNTYGVEGEGIAPVATWCSRRPSVTGPWWLAIVASVAVSRTIVLT